MILRLVVTSNLIGSVFSRLGGAECLTGLLTRLVLPTMLMLVVILALIFVLGWPLEWVPIVLIIIPIVLPFVQSAGIDIIWFCTLVKVTLQAAWPSPPVAPSAYLLMGVVPKWELKQIAPACCGSCCCRCWTWASCWPSRSSRPGSPRS